LLADPLLADPLLADPLLAGPSPVAPRWSPPPVSSATARSLRLAHDPVH
jgi:hypothetical protein